MNPREQIILMGSCFMEFIKNFTLAADIE